MKGTLAVIALAVGLYFVLFTEEQFEKKIRPFDKLWEGETTSTWKNKRDQVLFTRTFNQTHTAKPKAIIFFFHGMHSHSGEFFLRQHWANVSKQGDMVVFSLDQTGHGQSADDINRGYVLNWEYFIDDAFHFIDEMIQQPNFANTPFFMAGHSLGAGISMVTSLKVQDAISALHPAWKNWRGTILLAPPITQNMSPSWIEVEILKFIHSLGGHTWSLGPKHKREEFASEVAYMNYITDPYTYSGRMKLGLGFTLLDFMKVINDGVKSVKFPFLCIHGDRDKVTLLSGSQFLYDSSATPVDLKELVVYPGVRHDVMTDGIARSRAVPDILRWISKRLPNNEEQL